MPQVHIAIGSNVDPEHHVARAAELLLQAYPDIRFSSWYRNRAVGFEGEDFVNAVAGFSTSQPVEQVISRLHDIETACGRPRDAPRWAPRSMDLDILLYGDRVCDEPQLKLPRPDLLKRAYMLGPLAELAPGLMHPTAGATIGELWRRFDKGGHDLIRISVPPAAGRS